MIHLCPEGFDAPGIDCFWPWALREFPNAVVRCGEGAPVPKHLPPVSGGDVVLQYATLGASEYPEQSIALLWELYPEMTRYGMEPKGFIHQRSQLMHDAAASSKRRVVSSELVIPDFLTHGPIDVLPLGVDTDLMRPPKDKRCLRDKYRLAPNTVIGFWCGTPHPMKGFDLLLDYAASHPDIHWIVVWKYQRNSTPIPREMKARVREWTQIPQSILVELMGCADFVLGTSLLRPFYLVEWEAMACNLPVVVIGNPQKDFIPSANPRQDIFDRGWDRPTTKKIWLEYIGAIQ